ncbi:MAG: polysaccharide deacetylase family protein [Planctomycetes bacterium]|nr:polysaccharide deacetylase family protein [Planctomycetota bacterium]
MIKSVFIKLATLAAAAAALVLVPPPLSWVLAAAALALGLGVIAWGVFNVNSSFWAQTLWRGAGDEKRVALTFDDGPDAKFTPGVLRVLQEKGVPAAFFCVGKRVEQNPELARQIHDQGHLIGNHSFHHGMWINFGLHTTLRQEIDACNAAIEKAAGVKPNLYRPPHGFKNPALGDVLSDRQMLVIGWQVRGFDAVSNDAARITTRIVDGARPGGVITLHDGAGLQGTDDRSATVDALAVIIDGLRARGFKFVRLDDLLAIKAYS